MMEEAEKRLGILRGNLEELTKEVEETEQATELSLTEKKQRATLFGERITQDLLSLDGIEISKSKASEALMKKERKTAQKMAVLLARRKKLIKEFEKISDRIDKFSD